MRQTKRIQIAAVAVTMATFIGLGCGGSLAEGGQLGAAPSSQPCGTPESTDAQRLAIQMGMSARPRQLAGGNITIPVYVHIVLDDNGAGDVTDANIANQIDALNTAFAGQQSPGGFNTSFRFVLMGTDRTMNSTWFNSTQWSPEELAMKAALRQGTADDLNLYVKNMDNGLGGWATLPWGYASNPSADGICVRYVAMPGGSATGKNLGDVAVHEVGHWLGLDHTFAGGCTTTNDGVSDTPAERVPNYLWPVGVLDTCTGGKFRGNDPTMNFMDYTPDLGRYQFTRGQNDRMDYSWATYRSGR